jgi:DNA invertase Pin-like site-specific DNA recombinase
VRPFGLGGGSSLSTSAHTLSFAQFERAMIRERVRAGLARARGEGKRLGRPGPLPAQRKPPFGLR